jgi:hypothetical protein
MILITTRSKIKSAPERWREAYERSIYWKELQLGEEYTREEKYNQVNLLDLDTCKEEDITNIFNCSWTNISCDECKEDVKAAMQLGDIPDYESATAIVCALCLSEANTEVNG